MRRTPSSTGRSTVNRSAVAGVAAGLVLGAGVVLVGGLPSGLGAMGAVSLTSQDTSQDPSQDASQADNPHRAEHEAHVRDALAPLVESGTLTEAQVDAVVTALAEASPMGGEGHHGRGEHGPDEHGRGEPGAGREGRMGRGPSFDAVAELLGISVADIHTALQGGQSLADIAVAHGSNADAVVEVLLADLAAHLDEEVAAGDHTQAEADQMLADATARITAMVNGDAPAPGDGGGRGDHGPGAGGPHDDRDAESGR